MISRDRSARYDQIFTDFPDVARRLESAEPTSPLKGALTATRRLDLVARGNVALIGEASGSVDAITGEGMALAFRQAIALGDALEIGDLGAYQAEHRRIGRLPGGMARLLLQMDRRPWLRRRVLRALATEPVLFPKLLAMHVGMLRPLQFAVSGSASLVWRLLIA
jgi:flavin-dependent dehydrogenase